MIPTASSGPTGSSVASSHPTPGMITYCATMPMTNATGLRAT